MAASLHPYAGIWKIGCTSGQAAFDPPGIRLGLPGEPMMKSPGLPPSTVRDSPVSGLLPVVGVPLPFISYGGTHLVTLLSGFGILMAIHTHRKWIAQV